MSPTPTTPPPPTSPLRLSSRASSPQANESRDPWLLLRPPAQPTNPARTLPPIQPLHRQNQTPPRSPQTPVPEGQSTIARDASPGTRRNDRTPPHQSPAPKNPPPGTILCWTTSSTNSNPA